MTRRTLALVVSLAVAACRTSPEPVLREDPAPPRAASPDTAPQGAHTVALPAALERDGRIVSEPARRAAVRDEVTAPCEVVPSVDGTADVATTVLARVVAWHAAPGDVVRAGAPLVTLDAPLVAQHRTELERAQLDLHDATSRAREETAMMAQGATSARALRESQTATARAREAAVAARRALAVSQAGASGDSGLFTLRAPLGGTLTARNAVRGAVVEPPTVLATIVDLSTLRVAANLPEQASDVTVGATATVTLRGHAGTFRGRVVWREPVMQTATRTRVVHLALEGAPTLAPGETGSVRIERGDGDGVVVPASAVWREGSRAQVFVRTGDGRYEAREVVTGRESAGLVEVVSGVTAGAPVVVRGTFLVAAESARAAE